MKLTDYKNDKGNYWTGSSGSSYSYIAKNYDRDIIYNTRLRLMKNMKFNYNKSPQRYSYYMKAELGIILQ